ncbi:MAG TPA: hypothetical protein VF739_13265, partial [Ktedonobacterales bacterium]
IQTITRLLAVRPDGSCGLHVAPRCVNTLAEYGSYQYPTDPANGVGAHGVRPSGGANDLSELPSKANDHAMDATRYALHSHFAATRATDAWLATYLRPRTYRDHRGA